jgi:hypothetical protein
MIPTLGEYARITTDRITPPKPHINIQNLLFGKKLSTILKTSNLEKKAPSIKMLRYIKNISTQKFKPIALFNIKRLPPNIKIIIIK